MVGYNTIVKIFRDWKYNKPLIGTLNIDLDVTPDTGTEKLLTELVLNSLDATSSDTLTVYKDTKISANKIFDGVWGHRDFEGAIKFNDRQECSTKWIIVTSGSGTYYVNARYS